MPSWQARALNLFTRVSMKQTMRFGRSVHSMRRMVSVMNDWQERQIAGDIILKPVVNSNYEGERVSIRGRRAKRVLLYFPGGAFVMRTPAQHRNFVASLCRAGHVKALIVHYKLAPENPFPMGLQDCIAAYHDLLKQGIDPKDISIAGDSAGGGLVLSTLLALRDENTPMPRNAIAISSLGDLTYTGASRDYNARRDPMLPTHRKSKMHELYIGDALPEDRYLSPVLADFDGLPPMLGIAGSTEILLDDTVRAGKRAEEAGVPFFLEIWEDMPHVFPAFGILPESRLSTERIAQFMRDSEIEPLPRKYGWSSAEAAKNATKPRFCGTLRNYAARRGLAPSLGSH